MEVSTRPRGPHTWAVLSRRLGRRRASGCLYRARFAPRLRAWRGRRRPTYQCPLRSACSADLLSQAAQRISQHFADSQNRRHRRRPDIWGCGPRVRSAEGGWHAFAITLRGLCGTRRREVCDSGLRSRRSGGTRSASAQLAHSGLLFRWVSNPWEVACSASAQQVA